MRILLAIVLMLTAVPVWAKWVAVAESGTTVYSVDESHIKKEGDLRRLFLLEKKKSPGAGGEMSRKTQVEFDCKNRTSRPRSVTAYSASGETLYSNRPNEKAHPVERDSIEAQVLDRACAK
jgi:hypothetical protein